MQIAAQLASRIELDIQRAVSVKGRTRMDWLTDVGVVLATATVVFTARVVCEQTLVTWTQGVEMTEFSPPLGLDLIGVLWVILGVLWALTVVVWSVTSHQRISPTNRWLIALIVVCGGLWWVPYEQWKLLMVRVHGAQHVRKAWIVSAAAAGEIRLLDYLLAHGVDVNTRVKDGESPLGAAAAAGQMEAAQLLIARGAKRENRTLVTMETPLTEAAQMNRTAMVKLLLDHGAALGARDVFDRTALDWARENRNSEMADLIWARSKNDRPMSTELPPSTKLTHRPCPLRCAVPAACADADARDQDAAGLPPGEHHMSALLKALQPGTNFRASTAKFWVVGKPLATCLECIEITDGLIGSPCAKRISANRQQVRFGAA